MELETFIDKLQDLKCDNNQYTVTCNRILNIPLVIIKNNKNEIIECIDLK